MPLTRAGIPILRAIAGWRRAPTASPSSGRFTPWGGSGQRPAAVERDAVAPEGVQQPLRGHHPRGENTGQLEEAFLQLANYFDLELETRKRIKTAMRYPTFVLIAIAVAMVILNIMVIPVFAGMFAKFGVELPLATRILLATSHFFVHYWWLLLAILVGAVVGWRRWVATTKGRLTWHRWQLRLPIVGSIIERSLLARFARSFSMMLKAGVPLNTALTLVADAVDNAWMAGRSATCGAASSGESLLRTAGASGLFTLW